MSLFLDAHGAQVHHADWRALLDVVPRCDALIVDAPYSERTHAGHDDGAEDANGDVEHPDVRDNRARMALGVAAIRRPINYEPWTAGDVLAFVKAWSARCAGWFVSITDHGLAPAWEASLMAVGRYVFPPLPFVEIGSRVRLSGDGPSGWTCWVVVSRPRSLPFAHWGTLPGAYVVPPGLGDGKLRPVVGGKPLWLMERLIEDYSRPGDLIVDPCCGAGTTAVAAIRTGRRAIVGDVLKEHAEIAAARVGKPQQAPLFMTAGWER